MDFLNTLKLSGFPVSKAKKTFSDIQNTNDRQRWMEEKKWEAFNFHFKNNQSYNRFVGNRPTTWEEIPVMGRTEFRNHNISLVPDTNRQKKYYLRQTSGSTGKPFKYAIDYFCHTLTWLLIADRYQKAGASLNELQARFYGQPYGKLAKLKERFKDAISNRQRFSIIDLSDKSMNLWLEQFKKNPFKYIYGYSYPIVSFAKYLHSKNITLKSVCPKLALCVVTSEMCTQQEQELIEEAFGVPAYNEYGASEIGIIGFGRANKWELSEELIFIEILDDNNNVCPEGETGKVVFTSLFNKGTPLIRYEVGDLAKIERINGKAFITDLTGRMEDMAILPSGKKVAGDSAFFYVFKEFTKNCQAIEEYKIIQKTPSEFDVNIISPRELTTNEVQTFKKIAESYLEKNIVFNINRKEVLDRTKMGKFRRFENLSKKSTL